MSRLFEALSKLKIEHRQAEAPPPKLTQEAASPGIALVVPVELTGARSVTVHPIPTSRLVSLTDPGSLGSEKFRALATRLDHLRKQHEFKSLQVTSAVIREGKTLVAANLGVTLAKYLGSRTLLIEGDLHRPTLASLFGLSELQGLSHWWSGRDMGFSRFLHRLNDMPLWFLPAGKVDDQPSAILSSARFAEAFAEMTGQFDWVIVDSTPMLPIVDANLWSRLVGGTLLVVREGVTPVKALKKGLQALDHPKLIGVVLNDALESAQGNYEGGYYGASKQREMQRRREASSEVDL
jgi:capsular exopolysaccharide synthesis family protein